LKTSSFGGVPDDDAINPFERSGIGIEIDQVDAGHMPPRLTIVDSGEVVE
jgi:hypothetical protein